jgi:CDP-diacylglycerol--glycerol-3-phosphate 3-phosphatidyltransferase
MSETATAVPSRLRRQWAGVALFAAAGAAAGYVLLSEWWTTTEGGRWLLVAGGLAAIELDVLRRWLARNRYRATGPPRPTLGVANLLTVIRGLLLAAVAGFLPLAKPMDFGLWVPAGLYGAVVVLDYADGFLARWRDETTQLGASLDETFDTIGLFVAPLLAVSYAQLPVWYLAVPLAKPVYLLSLRLWEGPIGGRLGELPGSRARRPLATLQMTVTAVALSPLVSPPATTVLATVAMTPFLAVFLRDWLAVTGLVDQM